MHVSSCTCILIALLLAPALAGARQGELPYSLTHAAQARRQVPVEDVRAIDAARRRAEVDAGARVIGPRSKRLQVGDGNRVSITPEGAGVWQTLADGSHLWRVRVRAAGATDLRLAFAHLALPAGATLHVIGADHYYQGPYSASDAIDGRFDAPVVPGDIATVEVRVPANRELAPGDLEIGNVGAGFRDVFGRQTLQVGDPGASGACNVDVVCPLGQSYAEQVRAVGYYEFQADSLDYYACSGTLVTDVPRDRRNYFLTAAHCVSTASEAASMVVYWNYQSTRCGVLSAPAGGFFNDDQHGAQLRATRADVDFALVELSQAPAAAWDVYYAGWDASGIAPAGTIGIHHPQGDVKKITAGPSPASIANCVGGQATTDATHWLTGPYTQGTTEVGSSGSGLFTATSDNAHLLIGTLTGGDAACSDVLPTHPNAGNDCYGKFSVAWNGPAAGSRLRDWLDPHATGTTMQQGIDSHAVPPAMQFVHSPHAIPAVLLQPRHR